MSDDLLLIADGVVRAAGTPAADEVTPGWVLVRGERIAAMGTGDAPHAASVCQLEGTLVPGFVDLHAHGALGTDFGGSDVGGARRAAAHHAAAGTTTMLASLATAPLAELEAGIRALRPLVADGTLAGIHLEGPYLSPHRRGAHDPALLRTPDRDELRRLISAGGGDVRMVTIAPELPGAETVIRWLVEQGVVVAIGHTDASAELTARAFDWGATVATHLFNGMPPLHHREPGAAGAALLDSRVTVELILDGNHLHDTVADLVRRSASGRIALVSDAMSATGNADGDYEIAGSGVRVSAGVARTTDTGSLAGSTTMLGGTLSRLLALENMTLPEAVDLTSGAAARVLGLPVPGLQPGAFADLVLLARHPAEISRVNSGVRSGSDAGIAPAAPAVPAVSAVMRRGRWLPSS